MALSNILVVFGYLAKYLPFILSLMKGAEETKETGKVKKGIVTGVLKTVVNIAATESTGGAKESWAELEKPVSAVIDAVATAVFGSKDSIDFPTDEDR